MKTKTLETQTHLNTISTNLKMAKSQIVIGIKLSSDIITHFARSVHKAKTIV